MGDTEQGDIDYRDDRRPAIAQIIALYRAAALNRPLDEPARIERMYEAANLVLTAWDGEQLVGILRAWSDGGFLAYIADLAVDPAYQRRGIGRELLRRATASDPSLIYLLHAAPTAMDFYRHTGWRAMNNAWVWPRGNQGTTS
jgi:ribosomal protein S18 acetylase RimI-like enzyme